ncbi:hypothetical protein [Bacillus paramycoides]|uniref:hypothetical protein n=1 Tax=Bacillus paramycoides TaxID=2026194 RepID=UPI0037FDF433
MMGINIINDLKEYKDFFPFFSAIIGAITGGTITSVLTKSKEKKERREKRLNSLFELQRLYFKLIRSLIELELKLDVYISSPQEVEGYSVDVVNGAIHKCLDELADARVVSLGNAIHISDEVFNSVNVGMEEAMLLYVPVTVQKKHIHNGQLKFYSNDNLTAIQNTHKKIADLQRILMKQEKIYVSNYINKYINKI